MTYSPLGSIKTIPIMRLYPLVPFKQTTLKTSKTKKEKVLKKKTKGEE